MSPNHFVLPVLLSAVLCACGDGGMQPKTSMKAPEKIGVTDMLVYEPDGSVQCSPPGLTPQQSAQKLTNGGVDIMQSGCGSTTGVDVIAMCGADDGKLVLHEIRRVNLPDAEKLGFHDASELVDPAKGFGYAWVDCETRQVLP